MVLSLTPLVGVTLVGLIKVPLNDVTLADMLVSTTLSANLLTGLIFTSVFKPGRGVGDPDDLKDDDGLLPVEKDVDFEVAYEKDDLGAAIVLNEVTALPVLLDDDRACTLNEPTLTDLLAARLDGAFLPVVKDAICVILTS